MKTVFAICLTALSLLSTSVSAQDSEGREVNDPASTAGVLKARQEEAGVIRNFPSIAHRDGNMLTISRGGHPVARFTDSGIQHCDGSGTCNVWRFLGLITLQTAPGRHEAYAELRYLDGEGDSFLLIGENGEAAWLDEKPLVSPDGRYVATGETEGLDDASLTIIDWASPGHRIQAAFKSPCEPIEWSDAKTFSVICSRTDGAGTYRFDYVLGTVRQTVSDSWQLKQTDIVDDYLTRKPAIDRGFKPRSETADFAIRPEKSAKEQADDDAYDRNAGYEKLN